MVRIHMMKKQCLIFVMYLSFFFAQESCSDDALIATTSSVPPYVYLDDGEPAGLVVDVIREIESRISLPRINIQVLPWKRALRMAELGKSDFVFFSGHSIEREVWGDYMETPILTEHYKLYSLASDHVNISSHYDNAFKYRIGTERGCIYGYGALREAIDKKFHSNTVSNTITNNINMLLAGHVNVIAGDEIRVKWALRKLRVSGKVSAVTFKGSSEVVALEWPTHIIFSKQKGRERLKQKMEAALQGLKQDGTYQRIVGKYSLTPKMSL